MKMKSSTYFLMLLMAVMLVVMVLSLNMEYLTSKLLPLTVSGIVFVLGAIQLAKEVRTGPAKVEDETSAETEKERRGFLLAGAWIIGLFVAIWLLGLMVTIPIYTFAYAKTHGIGWFVSIVTAVLMTVVTYVVFEVLLGAQLYRGLLLMWLGY